METVPGMASEVVEIVRDVAVVDHEVDCHRISIGVVSQTPARERERERERES